MLIVKDNPVGIDLFIQRAQTQLHDVLLPKWTSTTAEYECYGRCYRNRKGDGYQAEVFDGKDYKDVYYNNKLHAISFFGIGDKTYLQFGAVTNVHLIFFVNLKKIKPSIAHRADEEVRREAINAIGNAYGLKLQSVELSLENVLKEYPVSRESVKNDDMHPAHFFRLNYIIKYDPNKTC